MYRQDIDPLADTIPPRHAYESDEEDELVDLPASNLGPQVSAEIDVRITTSDEKGQHQPLIVVNGKAGAVWARGAALGEQVGQIIVQSILIGLVFRPSWAKFPVIVSEPFTKLPVWCMHAYAEAILDTWKPLAVIILDAYSTATYITPAPIPHHEAPLRYLKISTSRTAKIELKIPSVQTFAPPNLLQSTSASFLSILTLPTWSSQSDGLAILVPSPRAPKPAPHSLDPNADVAVPTLESLEHSEDWDSATIESAHGALQSVAGCEKTNWSGGKIGSTAGTRKANHRKLGELEGSMYI